VDQPSLVRGCGSVPQPWRGRRDSGSARWASVAEPRHLPRPLAPENAHAGHQQLRATQRRQITVLVRGLENFAAHGTLPHPVARKRAPNPHVRPSRHVDLVHGRGTQRTLQLFPQKVETSRTREHGRSAARLQRHHHLAGQSQSTYRAREAMDRGRIVLACPGSGGTRDRLIANLRGSDSAGRPAPRTSRSAPAARPGCPRRRRHRSAPHRGRPKTAGGYRAAYQLAPLPREGRRRGGMPAGVVGTGQAGPLPTPTRSVQVSLGAADVSGGKPARSGRKAAPARIIRETEESGRAARQRPRPGTGGNSSHADSTYLAGDGLDGFIGWFADWWLPRGCRLTEPNRDG
jgi:hypothetical protein